MLNAGAVAQGSKFEQPLRLGHALDHRGARLVEARAYLDSMLVHTAIGLNEAGLFAYSDSRDEMTPWVTLPMADLVVASGLKNEMPK